MKRRGFMWLLPGVFCLVVAVALTLIVIVIEEFDKVYEEHLKLR